jgi:hypothetical protein
LIGCRRRGPPIRQAVAPTRRDWLRDLITAFDEVPSDLAPPATVANPSRRWRGRLESPPATMTVT